MHVCERVVVRIHGSVDMEVVFDLSVCLIFTSTCIH